MPKKFELLYPFGFGLPYTTFAYYRLITIPKSSTSGENTSITFKVKNTGKVAGFEITRGYVNDVAASVPRLEKELKGFKKVFLQPGESKTVKIVLNRRAFAL